MRDLTAQLLGPRCLDVALSYCDIGCSYYDMGQHDKALEFHSKAFVIQRENLGPRNKYIAAMCNCIGVVLADREDFNQAFAYYSTALDIYLDDFLNFSGHNEMAGSLENIGSLLKIESELSDRSCLERSLQYFAQSLEIQFETKGPIPIQAGTALYHVASVYQKMYKFDQALECVMHEIYVCSLILILSSDQVLYAIL